MATIYHTASGVASNVGNQLQLTTDRMLPPKQREEMLQKLRVFANQNPKLAAFLAAQIALTGLPLVLFLAFATTTLLISLTTCILLGLLAALAFTFVVVGFTLFFVVPTVFIASCSATFIFIWGFVGYVILRRLNGDEAPAKRGTRVGDKLQGLTGGRLGLWISHGEDESHDKKTLEVGTAPATNGQVGLNGGEDRRAASHQEGGRHINGMNGDNGTVEWKRKWTEGIQSQPVVLETGNTYEILKKDAPVS